MKKLSEQFQELSQRAAALENRTAAIHQENRKEFEASVAEAQDAVRSAQTAFDAKLDKIEDRVSTQWRELKGSFDAHVASVRQKAAKQKAALDLAGARADAEDAEVAAEIAAEFARLTVAGAEEAMVAAKQARATAQSMEKALK